MLRAALIEDLRSQELRPHPESSEGDRDRLYDGEDLATDVVEGLAALCADRGLDDLGARLIARFRGTKKRVDRIYTRRGLALVETLDRAFRRAAAEDVVSALESALELGWSARVGPREHVVPRWFQRWLGEAAASAGGQLQAGGAASATAAAMSAAAETWGLPALARAMSTVRVVDRLDRYFRDHSFWLTDATRGAEPPHPVDGAREADGLVRAITAAVPIAWSDDTDDATFVRAVRNPATAYSPSSTFAVGDVIEHTRFGRGIVLRSASDRMDVQFRDGPRTLRSGNAA